MPVLKVFTNCPPPLIVRFCPHRITDIMGQLGLSAGISTSGDLRTQCNIMIERLNQEMITSYISLEEGLERLHTFSYGHAQSCSHTMIKIDNFASQHFLSEYFADLENEKRNRDFLTCQV